MGIGFKLQNIQDTTGLSEEQDDTHRHTHRNTHTDRQTHTHTDTDRRTHTDTHTGTHPLLSVPLRLFVDDKFCVSKDR